MNFKKEDHEVDKFFRDRLANLDVGTQTHLWESISMELEKKKKSSRLLAFGWFTKMMVLFTIFSFGFILAYKLKMSHRSNQDSNPGIFMPAMLPQQKTAEQKDIEVNKPEMMSQDDQDNGGKNFTYTVENESIIKTNVDLKKTMKVSQKSNSTTKGFFEEQITNTIDNASYSDQNGIHSMISSKDVGEGTETKAIEKTELMEQLQVQHMNSIKSSMKANRKQKRELMDDCFSKNYSPLSHFDIDVYYSPEVSMRSINARSDAALAYAQKRAGSESFTGSSSVGFRLSFVTKQGVAIRTGINYSKIKERFEYFSGIDTSRTIHYDANRVPIDTTFSYNPRVETKYNAYKFLDIPIIIGYEVDLTDFVFSFNGGIGLNLSQRQTGQIYASNLSKVMDIASAKDEISGTKFFKDNVGISIIGSFGLNYKINRKLMLLAEPTVRYYLKPITEDVYPISQKYLQLGIVTGLRYRIY